jgi:hypothetical protein
MPDDHPFVTRKSYVYYAGAKLVSEGNIQKWINGGVLIVKEPCTQNLLKRVLVGASQSRHIPMKIIDVLKTQGLIEA